jgi:hypothetical protein
LGVHVAINLIADPDWDHERFRIVREWCVEQPEIVNITSTRLTLEPQAG